MAQSTRRLAVPMRRLGDYAEQPGGVATSSMVGQRYDRLVARIRGLEGQLTDIRQELSGPADVRTAFFGPSEYRAGTESRARASRPAIGRVGKSAAKRDPSWPEPARSFWSCSEDSG